MSSVTIDFQHYPHKAACNSGKVSVPFGEWLEAVDSLQASDHELRANFNKKGGSLQVYFNNDRSSNRAKFASISYGAQANLTVDSQDRQHVVDFIMERLRASRKLKVLTWNIGTSADLMNHVKSTKVQLSVALSYPEQPHFYDVVMPDKAKPVYDIICLQEVPALEHTIMLQSKPAYKWSRGSCVWVETFNSPDWNKLYKCYVSLRGDNALITLVNRDLYGTSASLSRTDLAFEKEPDPKSLTPVDRHIYYPFAQKIPVLGINVFNVHLKAKSGAADAYVRKKQLWELITHCNEPHNIIAGDFNADYYIKKEWDSLPFPFRHEFFIKPCDPSNFTYEKPCEASANDRQERVYDYIGLWRSQGSAPVNKKVPTHPWGFGKAHRHFPVKADIEFSSPRAVG